MTCSGIAVEQRSKETQALRSVLGYSLIVSVGLHVGIFAIGIENLWRKNSQAEVEPLEVTIVDEPAVEPEAKPPEIKAEPTPEAETPLRPAKVEVNNSREVAIASKPQTPVAPVAIAPLKLKSEPVKKFLEPTSKVQENKVQENSQPKTPQPSGQSSEKLSSLFSGIRDARTTQNNVSDTSGGSGSNVLVGTGTGNGTVVGIGNGTGNGTGTGNGLGTGTGNGLGIGTGNGLGTGTGNGTGTSLGNSNTRGNNGIVATGSKPRQTVESSNKPANSGNGRAACRECNAKYPEAARKRGIEGRVEVAVDTDERGNVTNVRIVNSSGNRDLDEETLRQARNWKLKPSNTGRTGVSIATDYAIAGSRRYRELQERKRQRQVRQQTTASSNNSNTESSNSPLNNSASNNTENRSRRRRTLNTSSPNTPPSQPSTATNNNTRTSTSDNQSSVRNSLRRVRRKRTLPQSQPNPTTAASSSSTNRLRNALRRSRQPSVSTPTPSETSTSPEKND